MAFASIHLASAIVRRNFHRSFGIPNFIQGKSYSSINFFFSLVEIIGFLAFLYHILVSGQLYFG